MVRSSSADLKVPSAFRLCTHSRCTAPGIVPPRAARTFLARYSSSARVSRSASVSAPSRACRSSALMCSDWRTRRTRAGDVFIKDHGFIQIDAALLEQVLHHPHERGQGFGAGIVQRDAKQIEMYRAGYPALGIGGGGTYVDDGQIGIPKPAVQL